MSWGFLSKKLGIGIQKKRLHKQPMGKLTVRGQEVQIARGYYIGTQRVKRLRG